MPSPILVVDDDPDIREMLTLVLDDSGYQTATANDGTTALAWVASHPPPRAILLDMRMPHMDGWAFVPRYRARPGPHAPIVVMTAAQDAERSCQQVGADGCLAKPFALGTLLAEVEKWAGAP